MGLLDDIHDELSAARRGPRSIAARAPASLTKAQRADLAAGRVTAGYLLWSDDETPGKPREKAA